MSQFRELFFIEFYIFVLSCMHLMSPTTESRISFLLERDLFSGKSQLVFGTDPAWVDSESTRTPPSWVDLNFWPNLLHKSTRVELTRSKFSSLKPSRLEKTESVPITNHNESTAMKKKKATLWLGNLGKSEPKKRKGVERKKGQLPEKRKRGLVFL